MKEEYDRHDFWHDVYCIFLGLIVGFILAVPIVALRCSSPSFEAGYLLGQLEQPAASASMPYATSALDDVMALDGAEVLASFYGSESGALTANQERYDPLGYTAAHRSLPFGTFIVAENLDNGRYATIRINDRGPNRRLHKRGIDVSLAVARDLGMVEAGLAVLRLRVIGAPGLMVQGRPAQGD